MRSNEETDEGSKKSDLGIKSGDSGDQSNDSFTRQLTHSNDRLVLSECNHDTQLGDLTTKQMNN